LAIASSIAEEVPHGKTTVEGDLEEVDTAKDVLNNMLRFIHKILIKNLISISHPLKINILQ